MWQLRKWAIIGAASFALLVMVTFASCKRMSSTLDSAAPANTSISTATLQATAVAKPSSTPSAPTSTASGLIQGRAIATPACPVEPADQSCPPKPIANLQIVITGADRSVHTVVTDATGHFSITLPAGTYILTATSQQGLLPTQQKSITVVVQAQMTANVTLQFDSGIR